MKDSILQGLRLDYLFMFFSYGALYLLARWVTHCFALTSYWSGIWLLARWLPLFAWLMDISENIFTALVLKNISRTIAQIQRASSVLKWLFVIIYAGIWAFYGISFLH
jgi:hypothetical protein